MTNLPQHRGWSSRIRLRATNGVLALVVVAQVVVATPSAAAQADKTFTVLYSFKGGADGAFPYADLVRDTAGNLYGTTIAGGAFGKGTVFKLDPTGGETVLYSFEGGSDGQWPAAGLVRDAAGNLYGTTNLGGSFDLGTVFKLDATGKETVLHGFTGPDGQYPVARLIRDAAGNLYGTTNYGGSSNNCSGGCGTVFKVDTTGAETVLHSFTKGRDGRYPEAGLVRDAAGNLYGTTSRGGDLLYGTVFKLDSTGAASVLHTFTGKPTDGLFPLAGLLRDAAGNLYSTTYGGGDIGRGTVFKLDATDAETVLYSFTGPADGAHPYAGLVRDTAGNFYGTSPDGGFSGFGTIFRLDTTGQLTVLHHFAEAPDGKKPYAGLVRDAAGNLYGTTSQGGALGLGTVFKLSR